MTDRNHADLIEHLKCYLAVDTADADKVVTEVIAYFQEPQEVFIRRRHHEMQKQGLSNTEIFSAIKAELQTQLFPATPVSERQIRRMIYG